VNADAYQRVDELLRQKLADERAATGRQKAEVRRSDFIEALPDLPEEEAVALGVATLQIRWIVEPGGWIRTRDEAKFEGAWYPIRLAIKTSTAGSPKTGNPLLPGIALVHPLSVARFKG
jgi:hypothetical protein